MREKLANMLDSAKTMRGASALILIIVSAFVLSGCSGKSLETNVPLVDGSDQSGAGLSWWSRAAIDAYLRQDTWRGNRSGYVVMFAHEGVPVYANAYGKGRIAP